MIDWGIRRAMVEAGALAGLPHDVAETLTYQTLLGSSRLPVAGSTGPAALRAAVTSLGGTTATGLRELERRRHAGGVPRPCDRGRCSSRELAH
jgi:pyrroline-5-carboxylate reductase